MKWFKNKICGMKVPNQIRQSFHDLFEEIMGIACKGRYTYKYFYSFIKTLMPKTFFEDRKT